jgi:hypothetical protein
MSHLDHIVRVKQKLAELGITCPFKQRGIIDNAFKDALVAHHFAVNPTFSLTDKERDVYRTQLDRWNNVSPVGYEAIYSGVIATLNLMYGSLRSTGRVSSSSINLELETEIATPLESEQSYKDLVSYLVQEVKKAHE